MISVRQDFSPFKKQTPSNNWHCLVFEGVDKSQFIRIRQFDELLTKLIWIYAQELPVRETLNGF